MQTYIVENTTTNFRHTTRAISARLAVVSTAYAEFRRDPDLLEGGDDLGRGGTALAHWLETGHTDVSWTERTAEYRLVIE